MRARSELTLLLPRSLIRAGCSRQAWDATSRLDRPAPIWHTVAATHARLGANSDPLDAASTNVAPGLHNQHGAVALLDNGNPHFFGANLGLRYRPDRTVAGKFNCARQSLHK